MQRILDRLRAQDPTVHATCRLRLGRAAFEMGYAPGATDLAAALSEGLVKAGRPAPERIGAPYWMESAMWQAVGVPTVVCGPAGGGMHADDEWLDLAQLRPFAAALAEAASAFIGVPARLLP